MVSSVRAAASPLRGGVTEALGCTCGGEGWVSTAPVTVAASFPRSLLGPGRSCGAGCSRDASHSHAFGDEPTRSSAVRGPSATSRVPVSCSSSAPALRFCPCTGGWRCPGCARAPGLARSSGAVGAAALGGSADACRGAPAAGAASRVGGQGHGKGGRCLRGRGCARVCAHHQPSALRREAGALPVEGSGSRHPLCVELCPKFGLASDFLTNFFFLSTFKIFHLLKSYCFFMEMNPSSKRLSEIRREVSSLNRMRLPGVEELARTVFPSCLLS